MARKPSVDARKRILDAAARLFDARGIHAVGIQEIVDQVGCGKQLLYSEFATKDDLVTAYLARCRDEWESIMAGAIEPFAGDPARQLVAAVEAVAERATGLGYRGCPVYNTHAEFPDSTHRANAAAVEHYEAVREFLRGLAEQAGAPNARDLADRLALIIDGLNLNGSILGAEGAAAAAVSFARDVVQAALPRPSGGKG